MSERLTEESVAAIKVRHESAVRGPYDSCYEDTGEGVSVFGPDGDGVCTAYGNLAYDVEDASQAAFFASSWEDVRALLADRAAQQAEITRLVARVGELEAAGNSLMAVIDQPVIEGESTLGRLVKASLGLRQALANGEQAP